LLTFLAASVINLFVPSGGGQWAVQGPVAMDAAVNAGVDPAKIVMAVAYGDQLTNMLQPFWALPLLAITGAKARDIVGYTAIVMVAAGAWISLGLLLF
jgi:short-chain fatty acids transporter